SLHGCGQLVTSLFQATPAGHHSTTPYSPCAQGRGGNRVIKRCGRPRRRASVEAPTKRHRGEITHERRIYRPRPHRPPHPHRQPTPVRAVRTEYEAVVPAFDRMEAIGVVLSGAGWDGIEGLSAATAVNGLVNFFTFDPSPVMALRGNDGRTVTYLAGNIVKAE